MKAFAQLFSQLDQTTKTTVKVAALATYFDQAEDQDKLWTIAILSHKRPKRAVNTTMLRKWAAEISEQPLWLFEESYHIVGDLAETIALFLPPATEQSDQTLSQWIEGLIQITKSEEEEKKTFILDAWNCLDYAERFVFNKLITGGFRIGVSQKLMTKALSKSTGIDEKILAHRLMGNWSPLDVDFYTLVVDNSNASENISLPYPFYLAYALDQEFEALGDTKLWQVERKWDGIRGQIIIREDQIFVWSRGEELVTDKFPEFAPLAKLLPNGTVIDGEIICMDDDKKIMSFNVLQQRIGRKNITKKILQTAPVKMLVYDLLEYQGEDIREKSMSERRVLLEEVLNNNDTNGILHLTEVLESATWEGFAAERAESRIHMAEGLMLKRKDAPYEIGRKRGGWWKWKVDPLTIDAVMIYAQRGHGRRANLFTDYTFAVWDGERLVTFAKAYSGLKDKEFEEVTKFVRKNTVETFGPVRSVKPTLVFELAFEGINKSSRHKSGVALRFPRIKRWRKDKPASEANTLEDLHKMLEMFG